MSWGSRLLGIGQIAAGAIMTGASGGALAGPGIGLITSGVGTIASGEAADKGNKAIEKATGQQQQATDKAVGLQQQVYNQSQANLAPYTHLGSQATGALGQMMGYAPMPTTALAPMSANTGPSPNMNTTAVPRPSGEGTGSVRRPQMQDPMTTAAISTQSTYDSAGGTLGDLAGGTITLRAPTGQTRVFTQGDPNIQKALSMGAVAV